MASSRVKKVVFPYSENVTNKTGGRGNYIILNCPIDDEITGQAPKLFIELNDGYEFDKIDLEKYLRENIEAIKVPKVYEVIAKIPRTFNGKIIRKDLKGK